MHYIFNKDLFIRKSSTEQGKDRDRDLPSAGSLPSLDSRQGQHWAYLSRQSVTSSRPLMWGAVAPTGE